MSEPREPALGSADASRGIALPAAEIEWAPGAATRGAAPLALAVGMFDGVHRGHQAVLTSAATAARGCGGQVGVFTFRPHPSRVLRPNQATQMLFHDASKAQRLFHHAVDLIIWKAFDVAFSKLPADAFGAMLREHLANLRSVHVGENFRFGHDRLGTPRLLAETLTPAGIEVVAVPRVVWQNDAISSTRVRAALREGAIDEVNFMLGEDYTCTGKIIGGKRLGRTIGFPTLNLGYDPECRPRFGVYLVHVCGEGGDTVPAVANYGLRPTVEESLEPRLEIHALRDLPSGWDAGATLTVDWLRFLRPEARFADLAALREQIARDVAQARVWFEAQR